VADQPLTLSTVADLSEAFSESDLPWKVDIVDWASIGEAFRSHIETHKVALQWKEHPVFMGIFLPCR
jgi:type I restriction enzyme S subunit